MIQNFMNIKPNCIYSFDIWLGNIWISASVGTEAMTNSALATRVLLLRFCWIFCSSAVFLHIVILPEVRKVYGILRLFCSTAQLQRH